MIKVTCLIDNATFENHVYAQQGLSLFIETSGKRILFDAGQSYQALKHNAERLKVDIHNLDIIIISHKDFDHIGGLSDLVKNLKSEPDIYFAHDYAHEGQPINSMILKEDWMVVENYKKLHKTSEEVKITNDIFITKPEQADVKEIALVINGNKGAVVFVGCSHPGINTMIESAKRITGVNKIRGVIGGFHLVDAPEKLIKEKVSYLKQQDLEFITCMHCTGYRAVSNIYQELSEILKINILGTLGVGNILQIGEGVEIQTSVNEQGVNLLRFSKKLLP